MLYSSIVRTNRFYPHSVKLTWVFLVAGCFLATDTATAATPPISLTL